MTRSSPRDSEYSMLKGCNGSASAIRNEPSIGSNNGSAPASQSPRAVNSFAKTSRSTRSFWRWTLARTSRGVVGAGR